MSDDPGLECSFCSRYADRTGALVAAATEGVAISDVCIEICWDLIAFDRRVARVPGGYEFGEQTLLSSRRFKLHLHTSS